MKGVDLFAGCGGMSLGFQAANFEILKAFEFWDEAIKCYRKNFTHEIVKADLSDFSRYGNEISLINPDIIFGGPPCQDFSQAGNRIEGSNADLTIAFAEIVAIAKPKWYVMENVERSRLSNAYSVAKEKLKKCGYAITEVVLDASYCGAPQKRKRFFSIGLISEEKDGFLLNELHGNLSKHPMTIRNFFNDEFQVEYYYRHPRNYNRRAIFSIDEPSPTIRGVNRPIPSGYQGHPNDPIKIEGIRELSTKERALIQTFPDEFKFASDSKTINEQLIGNAVPVKLAEFVAKAIMKFNYSQICQVENEQLTLNL